MKKNKQRDKRTRSVRCFYSAVKTTAHLEKVAFRCTDNFEQIYALHFSLEI